MNTRMIALALWGLLTAPTVLAHESEKDRAAQPTPGRDVAGAMVDIASVATDAVAVVERFSSALSAGDLVAVGAELDPAVLILESGAAEHSRDEYLQGHARHDVEFIKAAHVSLKRRVARAVGDQAWVASESEFHAMKDGQPLMISSTETMVLRRGADGWKIVHIHWSSRRR